MKWICVQDGAREHYAIPRALHRKGRLALLATEFWAGPMLRRIEERRTWGLGSRWHRELHDAAIVSWNLRYLLRRFAGSLSRERNRNAHDGFVRNGRGLSLRACGWLVERRVELGDKVVFSYDTTALELFRWAKTRSAMCVLGQMDPSRLEFELMREEQECWPRWTLREIEIPEEYFVRREQEWALADQVIVNSQFCRRALLQQGVPQKKLVVVPLAYEQPQKGSLSAGERERRRKGEPLRILFLGQVILRKGIQYLIDAAKLLRNENVVFDVVGPIGISNEALRTAPPNMIFHGRTSRDKTLDWYRSSDVFVLPTLSDGFAITQLEAMAHGLPVIATPNCGEVVTHGEDGFVVPIRDAAALANATRNYLANSDLLAVHSLAAVRKAAQFSLENLSLRLEAVAEAARGKMEVTRESESAR